MLENRPVSEPITVKVALESEAFVVSSDATTRRVRNPLLPATGSASDDPADDPTDGPATERDLVHGQAAHPVEPVQRLEISENIHLVPPVGWDAQRESAVRRGRRNTIALSVAVILAGTAVDVVVWKSVHRPPPADTAPGDVAEAAGPGESAERPIGIVSPAVAPPEGSRRLEPSTEGTDSTNAGANALAPAKRPDRERPSPPAAKARRPMLASSKRLAPFSTSPSSATVHAKGVAAPGPADSTKSNAIKSNGPGAGDYGMVLTPSARRPVTVLDETDPYSQ